MNGSRQTGPQEEDGGDDLDDIVFYAVFMAVLVGITHGGMILGRWAKRQTCMFIPIDPITVLFFILSCIGVGISYAFDIHLWVGICAAAAMISYVHGYVTGKFSHKGIVEMQINERNIDLMARNIAYYYNRELQTHCIQIQNFWRCLRRMVRNIHDTMDLPLGEIQSLTKVSVDCNYFTLSLEGAMAYVVKPEDKVIKKNGRSYTYQHYKFIPCDITKQGPFDFFLKTQLYMAGMEIAYEANAHRVKSELECQKAAADGGASILMSITKLDPSDAAANIRELKEFVQSNKKTIKESSEDYEKAREEKEEDSPKRWWQIWRRKKQTK